jgi:hypothetical protein
MVDMDEINGAGFFVPKAVQSHLEALARLASEKIYHNLKDPITWQDLLWLCVMVNLPDIEDVLPEKLDPLVKIAGGSETTKLIIQKDLDRLFMQHRGKRRKRLMGDSG